MGRPTACCSGSPASVGVGETFYRTSVAILQAPEGEPGGKTVPDPYFGGEGPERTTCSGCGGCMMGCRHGAKNTLDMNYLYLAEKRGAQVFAETRVVDVRPLRGSRRQRGIRGVDGEFHRLFRGKATKFTCRGVVFAASALGSMELLFHLKDKGSLPRISDQLGKRVRTNSESLIGVRVPGSRDDLSKGVAIGSGVYIDEHTHIEAVRYPEGSDTMGMLATILTGGRPGHGRALLWLRNLVTSLLRHPWNTVRLLQPFGWARESVILLCMQALDGHIDMAWKRPWFWPFRKCLVSRGDKVPTFIPAANEFARKLAEFAGGTAMSMLPEILFEVPGTAHCLGGCVIGASSRERRSRLAPSRLRLQEHVRLRRIGGRRQPGRESQPDDHGAHRARDELYTRGQRKCVERCGGGGLRQCLLTYAVASERCRHIWAHLFRHSVARAAGRC